MIAVGYARRSKADEGSGSIDAQRHAIETACRERGWDLAGIETDDGRSGATRKRPGLDRAVGAVEDGADVLVVARLDRLSRSVADFTGLVDQARKNGWAIVVLDFNLDMTTPHGELAANILAAFAQFERQLISARTREGIRAKQRAGTYRGRKPNIRANVRRRIRRWRETDPRTGRARLSYREIADRLTEEGVATPQGGQRWWPSVVRGALEGWRADEEG